MSRDHPYDGPSFSKKPPTTRKRIEKVAGWERQKGQEEEAKVLTAKSRSFHKLDTVGKFRVLFPDATLPDKPTSPIIRRRLP